MKSFTLQKTVCAVIDIWCAIKQMFNRAHIGLLVLWYNIFTAVNKFLFGQSESVTAWTHAGDISPLWHLNKADTNSCQSLLHLMSCAGMYANEIGLIRHDTGEIARINLKQERDILYNTDLMFGDLSLLRWMTVAGEAPAGSDLHPADELQDVPS